MSMFDNFRPEEGDDFLDFFEDQGDAIDRAMDTKAEQDMLADDELIDAMQAEQDVPLVINGKLTDAGKLYVQDERETLADDPEADEADALDAEADRMFAAYQCAHPVGPAPADQSLAYEPGDPKGKHALGWPDD